MGRALFEEVPGVFLNAFFPVDVDKSADCWLFKATIHSAVIDDGGMIS